MESSKKISQLAKEENHIKQMEINPVIKDLLLKELKSKKDCKNKQLNKPISQEEATLITFM